MVIDVAIVATVAVVGATSIIVVPLGIAISLLRRVSGSVGIAKPTEAMSKTENAGVKCALFRHLPGLADKLAWRSLGAVDKTPIHTYTCRGFGGKTSADLEFLVKREDLISPLYGGNKVRTLQHQLAVCESRRDGGETSFEQLVSLGTGGSNQVVAAVVHARALGWNGKRGGGGGDDDDGRPRCVNPCWVDSDAPDFDNTLNMLSVLSFPNVGWTFNWGDFDFKPAGLLRIVRSVRGAWTQNAFVPMMLGGNCPAGVLGQVSGMLELAEQIQAGESPDPARIYLPVGSSCTVSGLVVGAVLARHLGIAAFRDPDFAIVGCNVHPGIARLDRTFGFHTNRAFGFLPLTITHSVASACAALRDLGGPDITADALAFVRGRVSVRSDAEMVGEYGAHSAPSRATANLCDEHGSVTDDGADAASPLWICGHFVGKALVPLLQDLQERQATADSGGGNDKKPPPYMLWMTKSAVQPLGTVEEWDLLRGENDVVRKWADEGKAESTLRPGHVSTADGSSSDYRSIMTKVSS